MTVLVAIEPVARDRVERALLEDGFHRTIEIARHGAVRSTVWARTSGEIHFDCDMLSGAGVFLLRGDDHAALAETVGRVVRAEAPSIVLARAVAETRPGARARALLTLRFAATFDSHGLDRVELARFVRACLGDPRRPLRAAAVETLFALQWPELDEAILGLGSTGPELERLEREWRRVRAEFDRVARFESLGPLLDEGRYRDAWTASEGLEASFGLEPRLWEARARAGLALEESPHETAFAAAAWRALGGGDEAVRVAREALARAGDTEVDLPRLALRTLRALRWIDRPEDASEQHVELGLAMLETLADAPSRRRADLGFLFAVALLAEHPSAESVKRAAGHDAAIVASRPAFVEGHTLAGHARIIVGDYAAGDAAYDRAIAILIGRAPDAPIDPVELGLARFEQDLLGRPYVPPTIASLLESMRFMAKQRSERRGAVIELAARLLALPDHLVTPSARLAAWVDRAAALTALGRDDEAIDALRAALDAEPTDAPPLAALRYDLARALARTGEAHEAIAWLGEATGLDAELGARARVDEAFAALWDTGELVAATVAWDHAPDEEDADGARSEAEARLREGSLDEAFEASHRAIAASYAIDDRARVDLAWRAHGTILAASGAPERAVAILERALQIARLVGSPADVADLDHRLGVARLEAGNHEVAREHLERALEVRRLVIGEEHPLVVETLIELGREAASRAAFDEAEGHFRTAVVLVESFLDNDPEPTLFLTALDDLARVEGARLALAVERGAPRARVNESAFRALTALSAARDAGGLSPSHGARGIRRSLAAALGSIAPRSAEEQQESEGLLGAAFELEEPDPVVRGEKLYFLGLRGALKALERRGVPSTALARALSRAVRGEPREDGLADEPALRGLSVELAKRLSRDVDLFMVTMALSLGESGAQPIDEVVDALEALSLEALRRRTDEEGT